jgi:large subunit ribosomal protein L17
LGNRLGDNADMAMIELVDFNEIYNGGKKEEKKAKSRRGGKAKKAEAVAKAQVEETSSENYRRKTQNNEKLFINIKDNLIFSLSFFFFF